MANVLTVVCGICGVIQLGGAARQVVEEEVLDRMTDLMTHRGPDDRGTYRASGVALGVRRLSIVDVAGGHQPFSSERGEVWAIQNGELYNHLDLRRDLERDGHVLRSACDTEVLPHLYERDGERFTDRLRGKFGLAVWDARKRRAVLARDPLGVKPLYYSQVGDLLVFASELKSLLGSGLIEPRLDYEALETYLTLGYFPAPRSPLAGVSKLLPGHRLVTGPAGFSVEKYWSYPHPAPVTGPSIDEWGEALLERLEESVRLRLMSDVPLGAMLSGGLDSSLVVALMARNMREPVKTFSVGFADAGNVNELEDARLVARAVGADHHELELSLFDRQVDLTDLTWWMDEPVADLSSLGFLALSQLASRHVTVALSGQGADELLGGYLKHKAASLSRLVPRPLASALGAIGVYGPARVKRTAQTLAARTPAQRVLAMSGKLPNDIRRELAHGPFSVSDGQAALRAIERHAGGLSSDPLAETLFLDAQLALPDDMLHYFDRASMAHSLEVRVPFLDHHFVEFCATIPSRFKVRGLDGKYVLRRAARGIVPDRVIDKRKVGFFRDSTDLWFSEQAQGAISEWLLGPEPRYGDFLDRSVVRNLVASYRAGRAHTSTVHLLLAILMLEVWLATYVQRAVAQSSRLGPVRIPA